MTAALLKHLWKSPAARRGLWADSWKFLLFLVVIVVGKVTRLIEQDKLAGKNEGWYDLILTVGVFGLMWALAVIRAVRKSLRAEGLMER
ncbi:MAG: hypothetical protein V4773_11125 [Verrucomicrobiota bacterium]